jgi:hypothetical protein
MQALHDANLGHRSRVREPVSDLIVRLLLVIAPLSIGVAAAMLGVHFQAESAAARRGDPPDLLRYLDPIERLLAYMGVIGVVGLTALAIWSWVAVGNAKRVYHSLRSPWFAAAGWVVAPALGLVAHATLDHRLHAGSLIGCTAFLTALYVPFGTVGGAATDLGSSAQLARTWYLSSVVSAFLLIVGMSGATDGLPDSDVANRLRIRSIACYLAALTLVMCAALAAATARNLHAEISHRWLREVDPERAAASNLSLRWRRSGRRLRRRLVPTLFLRVLVTLGLFGVGAALTEQVAVRGGDAVDRDALRTAGLRIGAIALAVHGIYVLWAIVSSRNAHRRSIMAPTSLAVTSSFLGGPVLIVVGVRIGGPFGDAVLAVGIAVSFGGFVIGQMVLGRTVAALGGMGRILLGWLMVDLAAVLVGLFVTTHTVHGQQRAIDIGTQAVLTVANAGMAWAAMTRLDRAVIAYRNSGEVVIDNSPPASAAPVIPAQALSPLTLLAGEPAGFPAPSPALTSPALTSPALTSSQS